LLNYFVKGEEEKQGGKALENNQYAAEVKRLNNGLFIQVGDSPFAYYTKKGRQQLINASKAMPAAAGW
jgi:hypothetical protein